MAGKIFLDSIDFLSRETFAPESVDTYIKPFVREVGLWYEHEGHALHMFNVTDEEQRLRYSLRRKRNVPKHMQDP